MGAVLLGLTARQARSCYRPATSTGYLVLDCAGRGRHRRGLRHPSRAGADRLDSASGCCSGSLVRWWLRPRRVPGLRRAALGAVGSRAGAPAVPAAGAAAGGDHRRTRLHRRRGPATGGPTRLAASWSWPTPLHVLRREHLAGRPGDAPLRPSDRGPGYWDGRERIPLVAAAVGRFSRLALTAVALLLLSGIVQSIVLVGAFDAFVETAYGRLVLAKITLIPGADLARRLQPAAPAPPAPDGRGGRWRGARASRGAAAALGGVRGRAGAARAQPRLGAGGHRACRERLKPRLRPESPGRP